MDAIAALLAEQPVQLLSASDLHSRITLLKELLEEDTRACRAELLRRPSNCQEAPSLQPAAASSLCMLLQLSHDELEMVARELCDPLRPLPAVNLSSTAKGLRAPMQAALAQLREQRQEVEVFVALTGRKYIAQLRDAYCLELGSGHGRLLTLAHWRALGTLIRCCSLPRLKVIHICCSIYDNAATRACICLRRPSTTVFCPRSKCSPSNRHRSETRPPPSLPPLSPNGRYPRYRCSSSLTIRSEMWV